VVLLPDLLAIKMSLAYRSGIESPGPSSKLSVAVSQDDLGRGLP
jgi:hypothetical protein